jgi:endonuclease IV
MTIVRSVGTAIALVAALSACAQMPADRGAHHPGAAAPADRMAAMDAHMKAMRDMQDRMSRVQTPEECRALMADQMSLMKQGMDMMQTMKDGMGPPATGR